MEIIRAWRVTDRKYKDSAFTGEGARLWGGRFNSPGKRAVYCSGSLSLALLENLVQINDRSYFRKLIMFRIDIPSQLISAPYKAQLPSQWDKIPYSKVSQRYGDNWITDASFPILRIPSVVVKLEHNYIINPDHSDIHKISISEPGPLPLDPRLFDNSITM